MVLDGLDNPFSRQNWGSWLLYAKPQYSYKQAAIWIFVNYGRQLLTTSVLMVLVDALSLVCAPRNLELTILAFSEVLG